MPSKARRSTPNGNPWGDQRPGGQQNYSGYYPAGEPPGGEPGYELSHFSADWVQRSTWLIITGNRQTSVPSKSNNSSMCTGNSFHYFSVSGINMISKPALQPYFQLT